MAGKMYSWSTIIATGMEHPRDYIRPGDEVTSRDFDSKAEFEELVSIGAIRDTPYPIPEDTNFEGSPREYALARIAEMEQDQYEAAVVNTWAVPQLEERARQAMDESDHDPGELPNQEQVAAQEQAEQKQETRQALEGQAGKGKGAASVTPQQSGNAGKK